MYLIVIVFIISSNHLSNQKFALGLFSRCKIIKEIIAFKRIFPKPEGNFPNTSKMCFSCIA